MTKKKKSQKAPQKQLQGGFFYNKTLSNVINERIIIEAKRELYLTNKSVKKIAYQLGYANSS